MVQIKYDVNTYGDYDLTTNGSHGAGKPKVIYQYTCVYLRVNGMRVDYLRLPASITWHACELFAFTCKYNLCCLASVCSASTAVDKTLQLTVPLTSPAASLCQSACMSSEKQVAFQHVTMTQCQSTDC